jgi:hypothetical protein
MWPKTRRTSSASMQRSCLAVLDARTSGIEPAVLRKEYGDLDQAFAAADETLTLDLAIGRHSGVPLECRGALARRDRASGILELYGAAKRPHANRDVIARMLGRDPAGIQLFEGHIGGGFGVRGELYPEDLLVCLGRDRARSARSSGSRIGARISSRATSRASSLITSPWRSTRTAASSACRTSSFTIRARTCERTGARVPDMTAADAAQRLQDPGLPRDRAFPSYQQDAGRDVSSARAASSRRS